MNKPHRRKAELDALAPPRPEALIPDPWNWNSPEQARQALRLAGCEVADTTDGTLAALAHPLAQLLRHYRAASKRVSVYQASWIEHVAEDGRIYPSWRQCGAVTGRMSCSAPNLQQWPRGESRRCLVAPSDRVLVKADWSQLHLRIIAKVAPEPVMQAASLRGEFFRAYPGLKSWHCRQPESETTVRAPSGRRCCGVKKFSDKLAYSILLVEADCLKTALALLWERRDQVPGAFPVLACHDELMIECDQAQADQAEAWLVGIMLEAAVPYLAPVPVEVSASIGATWGGGELRTEQSYRRQR